MMGESEIGAFALGELNPSEEAASSDTFAGIFANPSTTLDYLIEIEFRPEQA